MRAVFLMASLYAILLLLFLTVREDRLSLALKAGIADSTRELIAQRPVDHRHTLFSELLVDEVKRNSPFYLQNQPRQVQGYELVTMSPCNPRIRSCG
jgi:hypothetical protein